ncbi:MAG TPA: hypothetical protein PLQ57_07760 [Saprospiraceae bacterium]|nr:hypothetical protein [Saprospiraceae bacterium]HRG64566.1 hypothetical protein [Saprospiraceae bacterium]
MKKTGLISFLLLILAFAMVSCNKDNIDNTSTEDGTLLPKIKVINDLMNRAVASPNAEGLDLGCFTIEYPFTLKDDQGGLHPVNDDTDFYTLFDSTTTGIVIVDYVYPINIADSTGTVTVINNLDELAQAFASCTPSGGWENGDFPAYLIDDETSCYNLVYPISLKNVNGDIVAITDKTAFLAALAEDLHFFVFPMTLDPVDGTADVVVNNTDELFNALISCGGMPCDTIINWENNFETIACYGIQFPITVTLINGTNQTIVNGQEFANVLLEGNVAGLVFPIQLIDEQNQVITVNSETELNELVNECNTIVDPNINELQILAIGTMDSVGTQPCYTVLFPVQAIPQSVQGTVVTVQNQSQLLEYAFNPTGEGYTLIYPVKVKENETNTEVIFNSLQEILNFLVNCH